MTRYEELTKACESAVAWVEDNLNPHQQLIITLDGIKVMSDDYFMPNKKAEVCLTNKRVCVVNQLGRFSSYELFYNEVKKDFPNLPPYANYHDMEGRVLSVITERKHLDDPSCTILVLTDDKYTYLLTKDPIYYKEVIE